MRNINYFRNKKVTIVGLARSGISCANLLFELGADVNITDNQDSGPVRLNAQKLKATDIKIELGRHTKEFIKGRDFIVISPGVPDSALPVVLAKQYGIPLISEIEVAWILCPAEIIAVTGSNGKTTVTTLIGKIIEASGRKAFVCGNIGNPFCGELPKIGPADYVVLEVSSFQLETISGFKPKISIILNFSRNHLDRYKDMMEYLEAKKRIFMNQDSSDFLVLNQNEPVLKELSKEAKAGLVYFSETSEFNPNYSVVMAVGEILGIDKEKILKVFGEFKGIEHRMEHVSSINGVKFINDSKATTVDSCVWALKNISNPIILIAGGKDKGVDYNLILAYSRGKVKGAILIGQARQKIGEAFKGKIPFEESGSLEEAVKKAFSKALAGDCVLLSPMCSSYDMFSNYEERGRVFKEIVLKLAAETKS